MEIEYKGKKNFMQANLNNNEQRDYYLISHKGKTIDYAPVNGWDFKTTWRRSIRDCIIRTLSKRSKYNGIYC